MKNSTQNITKIVCAVAIMAACLRLYAACSESASNTEVSPCNGNGTCHKDIADFNLYCDSGSASQKCVVVGQDEFDCTINMYNGVCNAGVCTYGAPTSDNIPQKGKTTTDVCEPYA